MTSNGVSTNQVLGTRLAVGFVQGQALYLLIDATSRHAWPSTDPVIYRALLLVLSFVPAIVMQGVSLVRPVRLIGWAAAAAAIAAGLGGYSAWRQMGASPGFGFTDVFALQLFASAGFFIAQALIVGGDMDRRFMATYSTHFDVAWKLALQLILTFFFELAFWGLLWLGALLFQLIGLAFLKTLISHSWFAVPVTSLVVAGALHLTDVQPGLVRGMRTLILALFSWLLPLMTVLAVGFLVALVFTGFQPLWRMGHASAELLVAAASLIILINAMYQDGSSERMPSAVLKYAGIAAALALVPLVLLAAYAIRLRVMQYGWTTDRVATVACVLVAAFYAAGYSVSVFMPGGPLKLIERWNFLAALLVLAVLLALFSPLADPARIAVASQVARLQSGAVTVAKFDFSYLKNGGLRFGRDALERLARSSDGPTRLAAQNARNGIFAQQRGQKPIRGTTEAEIVANVTVYPKGKSLPSSFLKQDWSAGRQGAFVPRCESRSGAVKIVCEAIVTDMDGDGKDEVLLLSERGGEENYAGYMFQQSPDGNWAYVATLGYPHCDGDLEALRAGKVELTPSLKQDAMIGGRRLAMNWLRPTIAACPNGH